jgi:hypothetical protein
MLHARFAFLAAFGLIPAAWTSALAQSVVSTHSGTVYFFEGSVYIGDQQLVQKFGRFPDIGEGCELRTAHGRAEVLLTPGAFLRIGENSAIRMLSTGFSDTRVELLAGSAILEANPPEVSRPDAKTDLRLMYRNWQVRLPRDGVYRIDSEPAQVSVYRGQADVSAKEETKAIAVRSSEVLPLAAVLVPEQAPVAAGDPFKNWAMSRSQAIASDNATAAGIIDDPRVIENSTGVPGALSYFPLTGIPGVDITNPYGLSFWSPYQSTLSSLYFPAYSYGLLYPTGWPSTLRYPLWRPYGTLTPPPPVGGRYPTRGIPGGSTYSAPTRIPRPVAPHAGPHAVGRRR